MLKDRRELEQALNDYKKKLVFNKKEAANLAAMAYKRFNIPTGDFMDIISSRVGLADVSDFYLFCVTYVLDVTKETLLHQEYFTEKEISLYLKTKIQNDLDNFFPIVFECIQVAPDQWIGSCNASFFMKLRNLQLIRYNPETQRTMTKVVRGDKEIFKISIDKKAAENIAKSFMEETYISDTITLNILPESDAKYHYDAKAKQLIIEHIDSFDMIDGFHRFFAMGFVEDQMDGFEYPMELRVTNFDVTKAKQFIYQQDQKTKMKRIDSDSMNMNNPAIIVLESLNQDITSPLKGAIRRNGGLINLGEYAVIINALFFDGVPAEKHRMQIIHTKKVLNQLFNCLFEADSSYAENPIKFNRLLLLTRGFMLFGERFITKGDPNHVADIEKNLDSRIKTRLLNRKITKNTLSIIDDLLEVAYVRK